MFSQLFSLFYLSVLAASSVALYTDSNANGRRVSRHHNKIARGLSPASAASQNLKLVKRDPPKKKHCKAKTNPPTNALSVSSNTTVSATTTTTTTSTQPTQTQTTATIQSKPPTKKPKPQVTKPKATPPPSNGNGYNGGASGGLFDASLNHAGGDATFYAPGLGACGETNSGDDLIAAMAFELFDTFADGGNPNNNKVCGQRVLATIPGVNSVIVTIVDRCAGCFDENSLDFSPRAFDILTNNQEGVGRFSGVLEWHFID